MQKECHGDWFGSINAHFAKVHFTMWTLVEEEVKVFHVNVSAVGWEEFTKECLEFVQRHGFNVQMYIQDNEQALLTERSSLSITHLICEVERFLETAYVFPWDVDTIGQEYRAVNYQQAKLMARDFREKTTDISNNIGNLRHRRKLSYADLPSVYTNANFAAMLAGLARHSDIHTKIFSIFFKMLQSLCNADGVAALQCINECVEFLRTKDFFIQKKFGQIYRDDQMLPSLESIAAMIGRCGLQSHCLLLSFDYDSSQRTGAQVGIYRDIKRGYHYASNEFRSIFGNCAFAVRFVPIPLPTITQSALTDFLTKAKTSSR